LESIYLSGKVSIKPPFFSPIELNQRRRGVITLEDEGDHIYVAPELSEGYEKSKGSDIWSLGVVFLQIVLNKSLEKLLHREKKTEELKL
jgi:serine/threonine protein kinase